MPVATNPKPRPEPPSILKPAGNRLVAIGNKKTKKKPPQQQQEAPEIRIPDSPVRRNVSVDTTCSSDSSFDASAPTKKKSSTETTQKHKGGRVRVAPDAAIDVPATVSLTPKKSGPPKRCDWITPYADPLYTAFHDEEWGVPVNDDRKLFELLVFSQALAEHTWPAILNQRHIFRKLFENFEPSSVAQFTEKKLLTLKINGNSLLSEPKRRAIVENAKQLLKVQQEFGSFSNYCWRFVNHKPVRNEFRYGRQVPVKTPKAELISKDMMRRGFQCVGPTIVYSFMQVAGLVNDHLITCFRYHKCNVTITRNEFKTEVKEEKVHSETLE